MDGHTTRQVHVLMTCVSVAWRIQLSSTFLVERVGRRVRSKDMLC